MSLVKLNNRSLGNNAVTSTAIASNAITTDKIANNTVTQSKIDSLGAILYSQDTSQNSATASGYITSSANLTLPSDSVITNNWAGMLSCTFLGYISSGSHYWAWRVYDTTASSVVLPIDGPCSYHWAGAGGVGGFRFRGSVHTASNQPARIFDISGRGGNVLVLQMTASNGSGTTNETSSQTLYADQIFWYGGALTGMHNEGGY